MKDMTLEILGLCQLYVFVLFIAICAMFISTFIFEHMFLAIQILVLQIFGVLQ